MGITSPSDDLSFPSGARDSAREAVRFATARQHVKRRLDIFHGVFTPLPTAFAIALSFGLTCGFATGTEPTPFQLGSRSENSIGRFQPPLSMVTPSAIPSPATLTQVIEIPNKPKIRTPTGIRTFAPHLVWPMIGQNAQHTGRATVDTSATSGALKWKFSPAAGTHACVTGKQPIVVTLLPGGDRIYLAFDIHTLYAIGASGSLAWTFDTIADINPPAVGTDGTIYVTSFSNSMYALRSDGTVRWRKSAIFDHNRVNMVSPPTIGNDGTIYVLGMLSGAAFNSDGTLRFARYGLGGSSWSAPAIAPDGTIYTTGSIYTGPSHSVSEFGSDGVLKSEFSYPDNGFIADPVVGPDGTVYVGSDANNLFALKPGSQSTQGKLNLLWKYTFGQSTCTSGERLGGECLVTRPALGADGTIYVGNHDGHLYAVAANGTLKWSFAAAGPVYGGPVIGGDGTIYFGSKDHYLYAINPNGTRRWRFGTGDQITGSPAIGGDGTIFTGSCDGYLYAIH